MMQVKGMMAIRLLLALVLCSLSSAVEPDDTMTFRCASTCIIYLDGTVVGTTAGTADRPLNVTIPRAANVLAVQLTRRTNYNGFVASSQRGLISDNTWKCVRTFEPDHAWIANVSWQDPNFDDSTWPTGHLYQYDDVRHRPWWPSYPDINNVAMWIGLGYTYDPWVDNVRVLCRKRLEHRVTLDCDDSCTLWVDGKPYASASFDVPFSFDLPTSAKIIAVDVDNTINQPGGLLLSSNKGLYSDSSWKCTSNRPPSGWQALNFDDSSWPQANWMYNDGLTRRHVDNSSKWIGSGCASASAHFYCRKRL